MFHHFLLQFLQTFYLGALLYIQKATAENMILGTHAASNGGKLLLVAKTVENLSEMNKYSGRNNSNGKVHTASSTGFTTG